MSSEDTLVPNLAPNANGAAAMLVQVLERSSPLGIVRMRLRDAYVALGEDGTTPHLCFFVAMGGDARGGSNAPLWFRARAHPLYVRDADSPIEGYATIVFHAPEHFHKVLRALATSVPLFAASPESKQEDAVLQHMGREVPDRLPKVGNDIVRGLLASFAYLLESFPKGP